ncbi:DUF4450 domain-containing protein [Echinicola sp. CAU 1574]|uniref:DUF4450 domain-containing protein n=1 Tax=Echinicola arenosa TaxID=2774144 RepID=A0ABR9ALS0_9BACT|nr:DUF4450 domain-containing protein [Echinicola arenosa]MBD8489748.1 DUF4450 domain-containing protein [Echinicola arenosa]
MSHLFSAPSNVLRIIVVALLCSSGAISPLLAQQFWHDEPREVRYTSDDGDFVIVNGERRYNRALYGYHSDFRTEAGDQPLFSFYLPGMGGHIRFGIQEGEQSKWLHEAEKIETRYRAGMMLYEITDPLLGKGKIQLQVMPLRSQEGAIFKVEGEEWPEDVALVCLYGGVTGKKFRRMGDLGADPPSVFDLTPEKSQGNDIHFNAQNELELFYGKANDQGHRSKMLGTFPPSAQLQTADPSQMDSPLSLLAAEASETVVLAGKMKLAENPLYFAIYRPGFAPLTYEQLEGAYQEADQDRKLLANRIQINTPDSYINTVGGALGIAADAIYDAPSYVHGAVAWRMPLPGWRGAYVADWMGWHDRAKTHFDGYLASQYLEPEGFRNDPDTAKHLARQVEKTGKSIFNKGYISRRPGAPSSPHHYDMNQVFFDQLIRHFDWTGDQEYLKAVWPSIVRHLDWEKLNFDPDGDGLYNAYASIWASDALQYNSGGVAHASAYNYFANKKAAVLASFVGESGDKYEQEAEKILHAMNKELWLETGWFAEYKDFLGAQLVHPQAGVWSVYHTIDSEVPDAFQAWQMTRYVDTQIPHIPLTAIGLPEGKYETLSTTNWMPYTWSVNNVALAEVLHTSLAYWQAGNQEEAFRLWKSAVLESMYLGGSPGNFQQLSFLDAMRSELYRDFADAVGMGARSLIEGLFGVKPSLLQGVLEIKPGFPAEWEHASLSTPDVLIDYKRDGDKDQYMIENRFGRDLQLKLNVQARKENIRQVSVNGKPVAWQLVENQVGWPRVLIKADLAASALVEIDWHGQALLTFPFPEKVVTGQAVEVDAPDVQVLKLNDPEKVFAMSAAVQGQTDFPEKVGECPGEKSFFVQLAQGEMSWWQAVAVNVLPAFDIFSVGGSSEERLEFSLVNNTQETENLLININGKEWKTNMSIGGGEKLKLGLSDLDLVRMGSNRVSVYKNKQLVAQKNVINWNIPAHVRSMEAVDISGSLNDKVTRIFRNEYVSPRSPYPTLQIPIQGMGDWASYGAYMDIDDGGLRALAGKKNHFTVPQGVPFQTSGDSSKNNILFVSQWDNYPNSAKVPLAGKAQHAYFLMAGSTNHMQSRMENGQVLVHYKDGSQDVLSLKNPETWWPIEQDYYIDGHAFDIDVPRPIRIHLKTGKISQKAHDNYVGIDHFTNYAIEGGAATVLDLPLDPNKELDFLEVKASTIEVIIGLMAVTLERGE